MSFPELITPNYSLQQFLPSDQQFVFEGLSNPEVIPFYGVQYSTFEATKGQMEFYSRIWNTRTGCWWKIVDNKTNEPVGACGMNGYQSMHEKAEIGYWLLPQHWKKGIMPEVLPVMIGHLFDKWPIWRLEAVIEAGNSASVKLSEKLGFKYEGTLRESEVKNGKRISLMLYSLLKSEWRL